MTTAEQILSSSTVRPKRFRVDEFRKMTEAGILPEESGWEIIDGYLIDKMTIGSKHASVVKRLNQMFTALVENRAIVSVQDPIEIDDFNEPEPDIALLKPRGDFYSMNHPTVKDILLLVEVSDSPIEYDRDIKIGIYAEAGIAEIWLVDLNEETIEQYLFPENGRYGSIETFRRGDSIQSDSLAELSLEVSAVLGLIKNG